MDKLTLTDSNVLQNIAKLAESNVAYLAPPKLFHPFDVERFQNNDVETSSQSVGKLEEPIAALMGDLLMQAGKGVTRFASVMTAFDFRGKLTVRFANLVQRRLKPFGRFDFFSARQGEKGFQAKVCPNDGVTQSVGNAFYGIYTEIYKQLAKRGALNGDGLDMAEDFSTFTEFEDQLTQTKFVAAYQLPSRLLERKRLVQFHFAERRTAKPLANLSGFVLKEKLIASSHPLANILYGLSIKQSEVGKAGKLLDFRNVLLQGIDVDILARQLEISTMKSNTVIPDQAGNINLLMKMLILFVCIQFELECFHWFFCSSIYRLIVSAEICPTDSQ